MHALALSTESRTLAGAILLTVVTIQVGGWFMTKIASDGVPMTPFQQSFARAGHGHAGVLVLLSLIGLLYVDSTQLHGALLWTARLAIPAAAILMPGGFFAASAGRGLIRPNRFVWLLWLGALSLAVGVITLGLGLILA